MQPLVRIENASAFIPGRLPREQVLSRINMEIFAGRHLALLGPNGSGKSSLLKLIHGDLWPASGSVAWLSEGGYETSPIHARRICGLVAPHIQTGWQTSAWNVKGSDMLASAGSDTPFASAVCAEQQERVAQIAERLGCAELLERPFDGMSQGQLRLLLIARELLADPLLLLLDEWHEGLDQDHHERVLNLLEEYSERTTFVCATHRPELLPNWIKGRLWLDGGSFREAPAAAPAPGHWAAEAPPSPGAPLFELENVDVYVSRRKVLKNLNWKMRRGEHWYINGANGSGKSTFLRLLAGEEFAAAGGSLLRPAEDGSQPETLRRRISLVSDLSKALYGYDLAGLELVLSGIDNSIGLYREFSGSEIRRAKDLLAEFFGQEAEQMAGRSIRRVSSGQLARLHLARALVSEPEALLLDEAESGLDQESRAMFLEILAQIAAGAYSSRPASIIMVSHGMEADLPPFFTHFATFANGELMRQGPISVF